MIWAVIFVVTLVGLFCFVLGRLTGLPNEGEDLVEHPKRIADFIEHTNKLDWSDAGLLASMTELADLHRQLFKSEIDYYFKRRRGRRASAIFFRGAGFIAGTAGALVPLLAVAEPRLAWLQPWGYLALGFAAAMFAGNRLFGGTEGHIRYVSAQYALEAQLQTFTLSWAKWRATLTPGRRPTAKQMADGFALMQAYANLGYDRIGNETAQWAAAVAAAEAEYTSNVSRQRSSAPSPPSPPPSPAPTSPPSPSPAPAPRRRR